MKIKRVEIQAFKSYHHAKDGTFVFSDEAGNPANFISIFAPNGFGKTSFCDAVDFAITNKIHRYSRMKQIEKLYDKEMREGNQTGERQFVIRNKFADSSLETAISVEVDSQNEAFQSEYRNPRVGGGDYKFDGESTVGTEFFQHAMLYQEAIDSVLRETDPEERFSKLAENEENLSKITINRASLIAAKNEAEKEKREVETDKAQISSELLIYDDRKKDVSTLNTHLKQVNSILNKNEFDILDELQPFTQERYDQFEQSAISTTRTIENLKTKASSSKSELIKQLSKLETYQAAYADKRVTDQEIALINDSQHKKKSIADLEKLKAGAIEEKNSYVDLLNKLKKNEAQVSGYFELKETYDSSLLEKKKINDIEEQRTSTLTSYRTEHKRLLEELNVLKKGLHEQSKLLQNSGQTFSDITFLQKMEKDLVQKLGELRQQDKNLNEDIEILNTNVVALNRLSIESANLTEYESIITEHMLPEFMQQKSLFKKHSETINEKKSLLTRKKQELDQIQIHSSQLQQIITQAHELILHTKQSECPVCQNSYADFSALEKKLKENPIYQDREQALLEESAELNKQISELDLFCKNALNKFDALKLDILQQLDKEISKKWDVKKGIDISRSRLAEEQNRAKENLNALNEKVSFNDKLSYESNLAKKLKQLEKQSIRLESVISEKENNINILVDKEGNSKGLLEKQNQTVSLLRRKLNSYNEFITFLEGYNWQNLNSREKLAQAFIAEIERVNLSREKETDSVEKMKEDLQKLKEAVPRKYLMTSISGLEQEKDSLRKKQTELSETILQFERLIEDINCPAPHRQNMEEISQIITQKVKELDEDIALYSTGISSLETAKALAKALVGAKGLKELEEKYRITENKEQVLDGIISELQDDIDILGQYIQSKVDAFFKTQLINQLYQAIDPHPEFKNICFECKTDGDKPKLLIKAKTSDDSMNVSPVLNFSSAQVNVLALSIFLARALTLTDNEGNPVNCIFIDDPVQSIDSINTLSLIDLFRMIAIKFDKQIIVTTHDENFHELLKKKMPTALFPSKYLRLESFGKVAVDAA